MAPKKICLLGICECELIWEKRIFEDTTKDFKMRSCSIKVATKSNDTVRIRDINKDIKQRDTEEKAM